MKSISQYFSGHKYVIPFIPLHHLKKESKTKQEKKCIRVQQMHLKNILNIL